MIGKGENRWKYEFRCRDCAKRTLIGKDVYCMPMRAGKDPIHADNDFRVRCDEYLPAQMEMEA